MKPLCPGRARRGWPISPEARVYNFSSMPEHIKKKLQDEINVLEHELSHELPKELKKAVALGDLSENAEYQDRKSTRLNSSHGYISYAVFCLKKKKKETKHQD